jgi:transposase
MLMTLSGAQRAELKSKAPAEGYDSSVASRAKIVLLHDEGYSAEDIASVIGTSKVTVYRWIDRYEEGGLPALESGQST